MWYTSPFESYSVGTMKLKVHASLFEACPYIRLYVGPLICPKIQISDVSIPL